MPCNPCIGCPRQPKGEGVAQLDWKQLTAELSERFGWEATKNDIQGSKTPQTNNWITYAKRCRSSNNAARQTTAQHSGQEVGEHAAQKLPFGKS